MKNIAFAGTGLIIVIIVLFIFSSKGKSAQDTLIPPQQSPVESPKQNTNISGESTKSAAIFPFPVLTIDEIQNKKVIITTVKGKIIIELSANAPIASSNFIYLTNKKFYDGLTFHRKEENFVIQGGDPKGNGTGGPGYSFPDEIVKDDYKRGVVAMANAGSNTNGSQFFIMLADAPNLPKNYTIFGQIVENIDVIDKIQVGDVIEKIIIE